MIYVEGSAEISPLLEAEMLIFEIGTLAYKEELNLTFELNADPDIVSTTLFLDDVESGMNGWSTDSRKGTNPWNIVNSKSLSGQMSWYIQETDNEEVDQMLTSPPLSVSGDNPVLRFWHQYNIVPGANGGFIEISTDGGVMWQEVDEKFILRNKYPGELAFSTFAIPSLKGFSGSTEGNWVDSYIDLNEYKGKNIIARFRFGNEGILVSSVNTPGWFVDEIELIDLEVYSSVACVFSSEDPENRCTDTQYTVVNSGSTTSVVDGDQENAKFSVFPNPAQQSISIILEEVEGDNKLTLKTIEGRTVISQILSNQSDLHVLDVSSLDSGLYLITIIDGYRSYTQKVQIIR